MTQTAQSSFVEEDGHVLVRVRVSIEFDTFRLGGNGIVTLKWKAPLSEMAEMLRTSLLVRQSGDTEPRYATVFLRYSETDEITGKVQKYAFTLGKFSFGSLFLRKDGTTALTLETIPEFMGIKITELGQLTNRSLSMVIRELASVKEEET